MVRQREGKVQADVSDNHSPECHAQCIALLPRHIYGRCAAVHVSGSWLVLEQRGVHYFHCIAVLGHVWYCSNEEATKDYIKWDLIRHMEKSTVFAFFNFTIGSTCFDAVPRFHGTMYRDNLSNFMTQYEATRTFSETLLETFTALFASVHGGVLSYERMQFLQRRVVMRLSYGL